MLATPFQLPINPPSTSLVTTFQHSSTLFHTYSTPFHILTPPLPPVIYLHQDYEASLVLLQGLIVDLQTSATANNNSNQSSSSSQSLEASGSGGGATAHKGIWATVSPARIGPGPRQTLVQAAKALEYLGDYHNFNTYHSILYHRIPLHPTIPPSHSNPISIPSLLLKLSRTLPNTFYHCTFSLFHRQSLHSHLPINPSTHEHPSLSNASPGSHRQPLHRGPRPHQPPPRHTTGRL